MGDELGDTSRSRTAVPSGGTIAEATGTGPGGVVGSRGPAAEGPATGPGVEPRPGARTGWRARAAALVRAARPKQWFKNVLVLAAPGAAGVLQAESVRSAIALAFVSLCLVASGTYMLNDVRDADADRRHPQKRRRPIASGAVPVPLALTAGAALIILGLAGAWVLGPAFLTAVAVYVTLSLLYTAWLKDVAVLDIVVIASFFVIRAAAGGFAVDVPISRWFLIVASFGSLFVVAGKRHGERLELGAASGSIRATLGTYTDDYLRYVWTMATGVTLAAYCLWAFEQEELASLATVPWYELSILPFVLFVLRYALMIEAGRASAPEDVVLGDRALQLIGLAWAVVFGCGVYLSG